MKGRFVLTDAEWLKKRFEDDPEPEIPQGLLPENMMKKIHEQKRTRVFDVTWLWRTAAVVTAAVLLVVGLPLLQNRSPYLSQVDNVHFFGSQEQLESVLSASPRAAMWQNDLLYGYSDAVIDGNRLITAVEGDSLTTVRVFDITDPHHPVKTAGFEQDGEFAAMAVQDGVVYIVSRTSGAIPRTGRNGNGMQALTHEQIATVDSPADSYFTVMTAWDLDGDVQTLAVFGHTGEVLIDGKTVYLSNSGVGQTRLLKIDFTDKKTALSAAQTVSGDRVALWKDDRQLYLQTTVNGTEQVTVLSEDLEILELTPTADSTRKSFPVCSLCDGAVCAKVTPQEIELYDNHTGELLSTIGF